MWRQVLLSDERVTAEGSYQCYPLIEVVGQLKTLLFAVRQDARGLVEDAARPLSFKDSKGNVFFDTDAPAATPPHQLGVRLAEGR